MNIQHNISLKEFTTFGIAVSAKLFCEINSINELKSILSEPSLLQEEKLILGGGSNLVFTKDYEGVVIKMNLRGIEVVEEDGVHIWLKVGAGEIWHEFVLYCIDNNWQGVENLSFIPETVGEEHMQNIGAYGVEIKDVFGSLEAVNIATGEMETFSHEQCQFGYRESVFKHTMKGQYIICSVTFRLNKNPSYNTSYGAIKNTLEANGIQEISAKAISDAVIQIRQNKLPDPSKIGNAGSFFKNPTVDFIDYEGLKAEFPKIPAYELPESKFKIPAAWLIEQCGWKGKRLGEIGVHTNQPLVLVNYGEGKGTDIKNLALEIQKSVTDKFGIALSMEVNIV